MFDVAVIGAGMAGLTCANQLHQAGYKVVVVDKSRGVGGRVATRRLQGTCADHGTCYLKPQGELLQKFVGVLCDRNILQVWTDTVYELDTASPSQLVEAKRYPRYVAPAGMTAIAKFLAANLEMRLSQRVQALSLTGEKTWNLTFEDTADELTAKAVVVAIPAPQAVILLESLTQTISSAFLDILRSVEFYPSLSVMAGYSQEFPLPTWKACNISNDSDLAWIGLDSSKRQNPEMPIFVLQSSAEFAQRYLDAQDLSSAAQQMLSRAAQLLIPGLDSPEWLQVHRWRYAFPSNPLNLDCLDAETLLPLVCCGDWCGGNLVEGAMNSGLAAAVRINQQMEMRSLPGESFLDAL